MACVMLMIDLSSDLCSSYLHFYIHPVKAFLFLFFHIGLQPSLVLLLIFDLYLRYRSFGRWLGFRKDMPVNWITLRLIGRAFFFYHANHLPEPQLGNQIDRKRILTGKRVSGRIDRGGR